MASFCLVSLSLLIQRSPIFNASNKDKCIRFDEHMTLKQQIKAIEKNVPWIYLYFAPPANCKNINKVAKDTLDEQRSITSRDLEALGATKIQSWSDDIGGFVEYFKKFKNVDLQGNVNLNEKLKMQIDNTSNFKKMEVASLKATEVVKAGVSTLGAGALAGIASYGGAMMFASASWKKLNITHRG